MDDLETTHMDACNEKCRLDAFEREWVHTANKYIDTRHLPMLGKMLKTFDDVSSAIGRWILFAVLFGGVLLLMWAVHGRFK